MCFFNSLKKTDFNSGIGENITFFPVNISGEKVVEHWYSEHVKYEYETPGWQAGTNYFTQIIWKATEEVCQ